MVKAIIEYMADYYNNDNISADQVLTVHDCGTDRLPQTFGISEDGI